MKKRIFILTLSLIFILSSILPSVTTVVRADKVVIIKDIGSHWGKKYIDQLIARGGVNGYDDGTFRPNNPITIAEFVTMALRSALDGNVSEKVDEHWASGIFKDANEKKYYYQMTSQKQNGVSQSTDMRWLT